ncbi:hypothetical protein V1511DRAFT_362406 [Dipodascopsis uninucleata]
MATTQQSTGFWSRIKRYGSATVTSHSDVDGDTEEDTHVHKVLVNYYLQTYGSIPAFLGGQVAQQSSQHSVNSLRLSNRTRAAVSLRGQNNSMPDMAHDMHRQDTHRQDGYHSQGSLSSHTARSTPKVSLQDIYERSQQQPHSQYSSRGPVDHHVNGMNSQAYLGPEAPSFQSRASSETVESGRSSSDSRVRERLRRRPVSPSSSVSAQSSVSSQSTHLPGSASSITLKASQLYQHQPPQSTYGPSKNAYMTQNQQYYQR